MISLGFIIGGFIFIAGIGFLLGSLFALNGRLNCVEENKELIKENDILYDVVDQLLNELPEEVKNKYIDNETKDIKFEVKI